MFPSKTLLSTILIALSVVDAFPLRGESPPTLGFTSRVNAGADTLDESSPTLGFTARADTLHESSPTLGFTARADTLHESSPTLGFTARADTLHESSPTLGFTAKADTLDESSPTLGFTARAGAFGWAQFDSQKSRSLRLRYIADTLDESSPTLGLRYIADTLDESSPTLGLRYIADTFDESSPTLGLRYIADTLDESSPTLGLRYIADTFDESSPTLGPRYIADILDESSPTLGFTARADTLGESSPTLGFTARVNARADTLNIAAADKTRAQAMQQFGNANKRAGSSSFSITNAATVYAAQVGIGSPANQYTLLIDTGSSNTWVGANTPYKLTGTSVATGNSVSVNYGSGSFSGEEYLYTVTLGSGLVITGQSISAASISTGFANFDGVLGVGPADLTQGTVSNVDSVPTVTDNLYSKGTIGTEALGVYFAPGGSAGELTFGGSDSSKTTSSLNYVPLTTTSPASDYWGIDQSIAYGSSTILSATAGIVDTGTTLILIATDAFQKYQSATGATLDNNTGLLMITSAQYANLQTLNFNIGGVNYGLTPNGQIWPRSLNTDIGGSSDSIYLIISDIGTNSGSGLDFVNGYSFLQRFYSVFDTTNHRVGLATTSSTSATFN